MSFDFVTHLDRFGHDSIAAEVIPFEGAEVREGVERIPMWVADMAFATAPAVIRHPTRLSVWPRLIEK